MSALAPLSLEIVEYLLKVWASLFRARSLDNCCIFSLGDIFPLVTFLCCISSIHLTAFSLLFLSWTGLVEVSGPIS